MKIHLWSKTKVGKWAAILTLLFIVLISLKLLTLRISIRIPLPTPFIAVLGVIGFVMGIVSFVKNKDRALLTLLSIPFGLFIIFWMVAEIVYPH